MSANRTARDTSAWTVIMTVIVGVLVLGGVTYFIGQVTAPATVTPNLADTTGDTGTVDEPADPTGTTTDFGIGEPLSAPALGTMGGGAGRVGTAVRVPAQSAGSVSLAGGITVPVPSGYTVDQASTTKASTMMTGDGAAIAVYLAKLKPGAIATAVVQDYVQQVIAPDVQGIKVGKAQAASLKLPSIASAGGIVYEASLVTQQGSAPIYGVIFALIRYDGVVALIDTMALQTVDITPAMKTVLEGVATTM